jgi:predicted Na+-dependent transporter
MCPKLLPGDASSWLLKLLMAGTAVQHLNMSANAAHTCLICFVAPSCLIFLLHLTHAHLQQLGGNVSLALLLTVVSNVLGIFTMPFILPHVVAASALGAAGSSTAGMLDPLALMLQLCQTILLPTFIGASIRGFVPGGCCCTCQGLTS